MNKLIIFFNRGQYSPVKDEFKKIYSSKFKWDRKQSWVGKTGYVKASKKMESGEAITFLIECDDKLTDKFFEFSKTNKIECKLVDNFNNIDVINVVEQTKMLTDRLDIKLNRAGNFLLTAMYRKDLSPRFIERWAELLKEDDDKFNNNKIIGGE